MTLTIPTPSGEWTVTRHDHNPGEVFIEGPPGDIHKGRQTATLDAVDLWVETRDDETRGYEWQPDLRSIPTAVLRAALDLLDGEAPDA